MLVLARASAKRLRHPLTDECTIEALGRVHTLLQGHGGYTCGCARMHRRREIHNSRDPHPIVSIRATTRGAQASARSPCAPTEARRATVGYQNMGYPIHGPNPHKKHNQTFRPKKAFGPWLSIPKTPHSRPNQPRYNLRLVRGLPVEALGWAVNLCRVRGSWEDHRRVHGFCLVRAPGAGLGSHKSPPR